MRRLLIVPIMLLATVASAGDWWVQAFGESTWVLGTKGTFGVSIDNQAIDQQDYKPPITKPAYGGGLMIGTNSPDGVRMYGVVVDYIGGTATTEFPVEEDQLGPGTLETNSSALQVSIFFAGRAPFLSSDSGTWHGYLGGGLGVISPMGELNLNYRDLNFDGVVVSENEIATLSGSLFMIDLFCMEEWHFAGKLGLAATLGFRGVPYKDSDISTTTMQGTYRSQFTGPYVRVGLRYDI